MKTKKQYIIGVVLILFCIIGIYYFVSSKNIELPVVIEKEKIEIENNINSKSVNVSLVISGQEYHTSIKEGASVFDAMEKMQKESTENNLFSFKYTNNASLGNFITEINNKKGTPGEYWIYYVNNEKASVGVSNYILKDGDIINWSQEGI